MREIVWIAASFFFLAAGVYSLLKHCPLLAIVAGLAAVMHYRAVPRELTFVKQVTRAAAYFGGGMVILAIIQQA